MTKTFEPGRTFDEKVNQVDVDSRGKYRTVFARFGSNGFTSESVFFVFTDAYVEVDARTRDCTGTYVGIVNSAASDVHVHEDEICFDLTLEPLTRSDIKVERWQGRLALQ